MSKLGHWLTAVLGVPSNIGCGSTMSKLGRWLVTALLPVPLLVMSGCWDRTELNELGSVSGTAVDAGAGGRWKVSFGLLQPQAASIQGLSGTTASPATVFSGEGDSLQTAQARAAGELPRKLDLRHNEAVVVSEAAARRGIDSLLDSYARNGDARETALMFVSEGEAGDILRAAPAGERGGQRSEPLGGL